MTKSHQIDKLFPNYINMNLKEKKNSNNKKYVLMMFYQISENLVYRLVVVVRFESLV